MPKEDLLQCDCGRRYVRKSVSLEEIEDGFALCRCERKLGVWSGLVGYTFEPESEGEDG